MQKLNMDVIGIEEMSNDSALTELVSTLPGYSSVLSHRWSYSFEPPIRISLLKDWIYL
jgi:hypothetical protein